MAEHPCVLAPAGILDASLGDGVCDDIRRALEGGHRSIRIDMKDVTFMDSAGFGSLVIALKKVREAGGELSLRNVNAQVRLVLELTGTERILMMFDT
jgi:anti-anti-sigma factor